MTARGVTRFSRVFLRPEIGPFSPHFGAISLLNYTDNPGEKRKNPLENNPGEKRKIHWRTFKRSSGETSPKLQNPSWSFDLLHEKRVRRPAKHEVILRPPLCHPLKHSTISGGCLWSGDTPLKHTSACKWRHSNNVLPGRQIKFPTMALGLLIIGATTEGNDQCKSSKSCNTYRKWFKASYLAGILWGNLGAHKTHESSSSSNEKILEKSW